MTGEWLLKLAAAVVLVEAVAEIVAEAVILERLRAWLEKDPEKPRLAGVLARCGYCQSFWLGLAAAFGLGLTLPFQIGWPGLVQAAAMGVVVHRLSGLWHDLFGWSRKLIVAICMWASK